MTRFADQPTFQQHQGHGSDPPAWAKGEQTLQTDHALNSRAMNGMTKNGHPSPGTARGTEIKRLR